MARRNQCQPACVNMAKRLQADGKGYFGRLAILVKNSRNRYYGEVNEDTLAILAHVLNKRLDYFYPPYLYKEKKQESLTRLENELLIHFRNIWDDSLR